MTCNYCSPRPHYRLIEYIWPASLLDLWSYSVALIRPEPNFQKIGFVVRRTLCYFNYAIEDKSSEVFWIFFPVNSFLPHILWLFRWQDGSIPVYSNDITLWDSFRNADLLSSTIPTHLAHIHVRRGDAVGDYFDDTVVYVPWCALQPHVKFQGDLPTGSKRMRWW